MEEWEIGVRKNPPMNKEVMRRNLKDLKQALDSAGIKFYLYMGTLLGFIRDNDFIVWDDDADILCFKEDKPKIAKVQEYLEKEKGFFIPRSNVPESDSFFIRDGEKIDIWWFTKDEAKNVRYYDPDRCPTWPAYDTVYFGNNTIRHNGEEYPIPNRAEEFLIVHYGKNWKTPTKERGWVF
jgi:hypothetical protein